MPTAEWHHTPIDAPNVHLPIPSCITLAASSLILFTLACKGSLTHIWLGVYYANFLGNCTYRGFSAGDFICIESLQLAQRFSCPKAEEYIYSLIHIPSNFLLSLCLPLGVSVVCTTYFFSSRLMNRP